jgi:hypothetical protein
MTAHQTNLKIASLKLKENKYQFKQVTKVLGVRLRSKCPRESSVYIKADTS